MADNIYTVNPTSIQDIAQYEKYSAEDVNLIESFEINSTFNTQKHISELHIYTTGNTLLRSITNYSRYKIEQGSGASTEGSTSISLDPQQDAVFYGYENGGVKLLYIFFNNLFSDLKLGPKLYIKEISNDRTELKLSSTGILSEDLKKYALEVKKRIEDTSYFSEFRLNFGNNDLFIGINIDFNDEEQVVTIKLYEPLPTGFTLKSTLDIVEFVSNPLAYEVEAEFVPDAPRVPRLREANFNVDLEDNTAVPSQFFNYDELFSFDVSNTNYQVLSLFNERGAQISIDHTDYSDFIHFSSAEERLINFKYKLDLIKNYETSINNIRTPQGSSGITNNTAYYQDLIKGIVDNFDHYERYLYFESGSYAWPKSNQNKPYVNQGSSTSEAITWFANQRTTANNYDVSNFNALTNTIPAFIREDDNNAQYVLFVQMLAQHFDNLYVYAKAVSDKYDADNRINVGVSRDLVEDAIKSLGVKLYNSSKSLEDLFKYFVGEFQLDTEERVNKDVQAGQLISGGATTTGLNNGFIGTAINPIGVKDYYDEGNGFYYERFGYNTFYIRYWRYPNDQDATTTFSDGFNSSDGNLGEIAYVTLIDTTTNTVFLDNAPYYTGNLHKIVAPAGYAYIKMVSPESKEKTSIRLHYIDANGIDHSSSFKTLNGNTNLKTIVKSSNTVEKPVVQREYQPTSEDIYQKSIYKRIYHNLPFLLKTKGTQRGLRALINCFGIPGNVLKIKTYGGRDTSERPFFGDGQSHTVSSQKVRTDNTGSIVEGDTLSRYTSIVKTDDSYNQDLHNVEVGFSPSDNLDSLIQSTLGSDFTIDDYIGDPRDLTLDSYTDLSGIVKTALASVTERYDIKDFVRLIKFFDNVIFKMIKDFVPARSTTDTGIIIKPHLLDKSKAKSVIASATQPEYSGSIDTAFISGSHGGAFQISTGESSTAYIRTVQTPFGRLQKVWSPTTSPSTDGDQRQFLRNHEEAKFDGDFANSIIRVTNGELNDENPFKNILYPGIEYKVFMYKEPPTSICLFRNADGSVIEYNSPYIISSLGTVNLAEIFNNIVPGDTKFYKTFTISRDGENVSNLNEELDKDGDNLYTEEGLGQYETVDILAYSLQGAASVDDDGDCYTKRTLKLVQCTLEVNSLTGFITNDRPFNLYTELGFNYDSSINSTDNLVFTKQVNGGQEETIQNPESHTFDHDGGSTVVLEMYDNQDPEGCSISRTLTVSLCNLGVNPGASTPPPGENFIPTNYFFGYSDTTKYYVKIHVTAASNFVTDSNKRSDRVLSSEYGVLLTSEEVANGIPNDEIELFNLFLDPNTPKPSNGFKAINFYAVNQEVENCEASSGLIILAEGIPHARYVTLVYKKPTSTYPSFPICPCSNYTAWNTIRVWYYTEKNLNNPGGVLKYNGALTYDLTPEILAASNTQIFWKKGNDNTNPDLSITRYDDRLLTGDDQLGFEAARDSGGKAGDTDLRALSGYYINAYPDNINEFPEFENPVDESSYSYAKFNRDTLYPKISWTDSGIKNCDECN